MGVAGADGELHLWDDPHKVVRVSGNAPITVGGQVVEEFALDHGARFEWCGAHFELDLGSTVLQELKQAPDPRACAPAALQGLGPKSLPWAKGDPAG